MKAFFLMIVLVLFTGVDNTRPFDYETLLLNDQFKTAYRLLLDQHPETEAGKWMRPYYELLEKSGFRESQDTKNYIEAITPHNPDISKGLSAEALLRVIDAHPKTSTITPGPGSVRQAIRFPKGSHSTVISNSVIRGEVNRYELMAKAGQTMTVKITAEEKNAAFTIYQPGWVEKVEDDMSFIEGPTLSGAGEGEDAVEWQGKLALAGKYLLEVGGTRGNATYTLSISIQ